LKAKGHPVQKFGLFSYETFNLGDEIQSLAASQFFPSVDVFVDRDQSSSFVSDDGVPVKMIMNGWHSHWPENWPPSSDIIPLLLSMHLTQTWSSSGTIPAKVMLAGKGLNYFLGHQPIGARDLATLQLFKKAGIESFFSGCMTLTLRRPDVASENDLIIVNDVPAAVEARMNAAGRPFKKITQISYEKDRTKRYRMALGLLDQYARASLVVTSRLHCALPCLAFGTPVVLVSSAEDQTRFAGLDRFLHVIDPECFIEGMPFDLSRPPEPKTDHESVRGLLARTCIEFVGENCWSRPGDGFEAIKLALS
jgi:hypothetical protein